MHTKYGILRNTFEQMLADAEDKGREGIQPMLSPEDVKDILYALKLAEPVTDCKNASKRIDSPLAATAEGMVSSDYKERFKAEYLQTKIRYEKLKAFNNRIEAAFATNYRKNSVEMPVFDCPQDMLREQQRAMGEYLHILEVRAVIEGVDLTSI